MYFVKCILTILKGAKGPPAVPRERTESISSWERGPRTPGGWEPPPPWWRLGPALRSEKIDVDDEFIEQFGRSNRVDVRP